MKQTKRKVIMKYSQYYKIVHRRNKYNVKFLVDFLTLYFPLPAVDYDESTGIFSIPGYLVGAISDVSLNIISRAISKHGYYDAFRDNQLLIIPLIT